MPPVSYTRIPQTPGGNGFASFFQHRWRPNIALENFGDRCRWYDRTMVQWFSISGIMRYWASEVSGLIMINYGPIIIPTDELMTNSYFSEGLGWNHQPEMLKHHPLLTTINHMDRSTTNQLEMTNWADGFVVSTLVCFEASGRWIRWFPPKELIYPAR